MGLGVSELAGGGSRGCGPSGWPTTVTATGRCSELARSVLSLREFEPERLNMPESRPRRSFLLERMSLATLMSESDPWICKAIKESWNKTLDKICALLGHPPIFHSRNCDYSWSDCAVCPSVPSSSCAARVADRFAWSRRRDANRDASPCWNHAPCRPTRSRWIAWMIHCHRLGAICSVSKEHSL